MEAAGRQLTVRACLPRKKRELALGVIEVILKIS